ncbi:lipoprotein [Streptomyces davaonensis JCM 4913]|uniref:Lipoprotein n=1 Tax=Streptomyces davaonensis (strain DSM 101723 / JCM 4913 / KCC S-0913 / 768) TaxID=1214101 RepID=K4QXP5_STRDJ|nr:glycosyl hydrolase [Streptomyces davaonensis]CCK25630.1 lipoprotein [Streptomyces davaonensis JCM 4913]
MRTLRRMRGRTAFLLALLLVIAAVTGTAAVIQVGRSDSGDIDGKPAAVAGTADHTVTFRNRTDSRIWVGSSVNADGSAALTGLPVLDPGQSATITVPERAGTGHWRGKFFARQGCGGEEGSTFHCAVGDCGPYADHCSLGEQPTGLAEFNFDPADALAPWYNVSYVNAVSVPITITPDNVPVPESGECAMAGCAEELLSACPADDLVKDPATGEPLVCVNPNRDAKTAYSDMIAQKCPTAYGWSKQDAEPGNRVVYQCTECTGMTVTFGSGGTTAPPAPAPNDPGGDTAASTRRGISLNPVDGAAQALTDSGAHWYFNWASSTGPVAEPDGVEYVPMIWGAGSVTDAELGQAAQQGSALLGFNEPDRPEQSAMSPEQALDLWPRLESTGLRLGAPAVSHGGDVAGGWLDRFMQGAAERGLRVDFIPLHWYGGDFGPDAANQLRGYLKAVHDRYHKPIWLTEYGLIDFSRNPPRYPSEQEQTGFIESSTDLLEGLDFVERYAWFTLSTRTAPTGLYDGTTANASGRAYRDADPDR